jgi:hypothetical protein
MIKNAILILVVLVYSTSVVADQVKIDTKDYLALIVGNYVNGFNEFDTTVVAFKKSVSVSIYYDTHNQDRERAEQLADRFRKQIPYLINRYEWAKGTSLIVNIYSELRMISRQ